MQGLSLSLFPLEVVPFYYLSTADAASLLRFFQEKKGDYQLNDNWIKQVHTGEPLLNDIIITTYCGISERTYIGSLKSYLVCLCARARDSVGEREMND